MLKKSLFFKIMIHFLLPALKKAKSIIDKMNAIIKCYFSIFILPGNSHRMLRIKRYIFYFNIYVSFSFFFFGYSIATMDMCVQHLRKSTRMYILFWIFSLFVFFFKLHMYIHVYCELIFINVLENCTMFNYFFTN